MRIILTSMTILFLIAAWVSASEIVIVPTGTSDDAPHIQASLDGLENGDTLRLNGDFIIKHTIYLPSSITWILDGSLTVSENIDLDRVGFVGPGVDARRPTAITEKPGGATDIEMSGGTYYGYDIHNGSSSIRFLNFVSVTDSYFHDFTVDEGSDDGFTLGPECRYNECRNLTGTGAHGNALTDKGEYNKWYDCIAEDCDSDGWTPKCRFSEFHRCIGRRNAGPGFGMFARLDGSGNPVDLGEIIVGNKFYDCESYDNIRSGFSFNIAGTSGHGSIIRDNYIQAVCYNNGIQGVTFRNKQDDGIIENNVVDIIAYGNRGLNSSGGISSFAGGLGVEGSMSGISGSVIAYDNAGYDVNIKTASSCTIKAYHPDNQNEPVLNSGSGGNTIEVISFSCSDQLEAWCQYKYCGDPTPPMPGAPVDISAEAVSYDQIKLSWTDDAGEKDGFVIEQKTTGMFAVIATVDANSNSFLIGGLTELTEYTYRVRAINITGSSDYSNESSAITGANTTSVQNPESGRGIELLCHPNPFREKTRITYSIKKDCFVSLKVFDSTGRKLNTIVDEKMPEGTHVVIFEGSHLSEGTYFYMLRAGDHLESGKFIRL